eukprot:TRINITY_DN14113_c0_g1_i1.p1 TRINITY_DN14113_c0_g1~~TRINITY_DN14113_c0_g1_i1.p1  ORF type:complete len:220 (-),score=33.90 TRINITY_DN14113_c0_g1_i1:227-832(-)
MEELYRQEFEKHVQNVPKLISEAITYSDDHDTMKAKIMEAEKRYNQAEQAFKQLQTQNHYNENLDRFRKTLVKLRQDLKQAINQGHSSELMGSAKSGEYQKLQDPRTAKVSRANETLVQAKQHLYTAKDTGIAISEDLYKNRETILRSTNRTRELSGILGGAERVLRNMSKREIQNRLFVLVITLILFLVVGFTVYTMFSK